MIAAIHTQFSVPFVQQLVFVTEKRRTIRMIELQYGYLREPGFSRQQHNAIAERIAGILLKTIVEYDF